MAGSERTLLRGLAMMLVVVSLLPAFAAVAAVSCPSDPASDCGSDCLDCTCCPHLPPVVIVARAVPLGIHDLGVAQADHGRSVSDPDRPGILHVPKLNLL
jgi:hypothetical protein